MFDSAKIGFYYHTEKEMSCVTSNFMFENPVITKSKLTGEPVQICTLKNLKVKFYPQSKYATIENSLNKFYHYNNPLLNVRPDLCCNSTYSNIVFVADYISSIFQKNKREMRISNLEFSLTVKTPEPPLTYIDGFNSINLKPFYPLPPPYNHSKPLQKYCPFTQYTVKSYDYGAWNNLSGNYLRWEIVFRKMQKVNQLTHRAKITLQDITDKRFIGDITNFSFETYRKINKQLMIDYSALKPRERIFLFACENTRYWREEIKINPNTAKKKRADYLSLYNRLANGRNNPYNELEQCLRTKFDYLLNN